MDGLFLFSYLFYIMGHPLVTKLKRRNIIFLFLSLVFMSLDWWAHEQRPGNYKRTTPGLRSSSSIHVLSFVEDWPSVCDSIERWPILLPFPVKDSKGTDKQFLWLALSFSFIRSDADMQRCLEMNENKGAPDLCAMHAIEMETVHVHKDKPSAASGT